MLFDSVKFTGLAGPSALNGIESSKITATISYSTVNNPQNPTSGKSFYYGIGFEGGPLQGNVNTITNSFVTTYFHPVNKRRNVIGLKFQTGMITGYNGTNVPPYSRFFLGGENDVRGFNFYTISPFVEIPYATTQPVAFFNPTLLNAQGKPTLQSIDVPMIQFLPTRPGGDFQNVGNVEYRIPIAGPVTLTLFNDVGINGILRKSQLALDPSAVTRVSAAISESGFPELEDCEQSADLSRHQFQSTYFGGRGARRDFADRERAFPHLLCVQLFAAGRHHKRIERRIRSERGGEERAAARSAADADRAATASIYRNEHATYSGGIDRTAAYLPFYGG